MTLYNGERQVAPELSGIRADHLARYRFAARVLPSGARVADFLCGVGYGSAVLAEAGLSVVGYDREPAAIAYGREHYQRRNMLLRCGDALEEARFLVDNVFDAVVCFEGVEHIEDPLPLLREFARVAPRLLVSVPNEAVFPHRGQIRFHFRHYRRDEFFALLAEAGWRVTAWYGQAGPQSDLEPETEGRTLVADCVRAQDVALTSEAVMRQTAAAIERHDAAIVAQAPQTSFVHLPGRVPESVAILGLGPSLNAYVDIVKRIGGASALYDEVWGINALGDIVKCDRIFHMDDVRIQEARAEADPDGAIAKMLRWMRKHPGPIITSRAHPDYPGLVEFPLEDVLNTCGFPYFNSTAAYAVAYALFLGVKRIGLYGIDYTYPDVHAAEKGRACVEFWLGIATARGINIQIGQTSTLMDARVPPPERVYGYDTLDVKVQCDENGRYVVSKTERPPERIPTAEEVEAAYDHDKHTLPEFQQQEAA